MSVPAWRMCLRGECVENTLTNVTKINNLTSHIVITPFTSRFNDSFPSGSCHMTSDVRLGAYGV